MNRSGYTEDADNNWELIMWRGQVASAIRGKRGQALLKEMLEALNAMPNKRLIAEDLRHGGDVCALGCLGEKRGMELEKLDPEDYDALAGAFGVAQQLIREIEYVNDDGVWGWNEETPEQRWQRVRCWVAGKIR